MPVGPRIPVEIQLEKAGVGPTSGPTWRPSHLRGDAEHGVEIEVQQRLDLGFGRIVASESEAPNMVLNMVQSGCAVLQSDDATEP